MDDCNDTYVQQFLKFTIGNIFGQDIVCREPVYRCDDYQPGALVDFGRTVVQLFRKFILPGGLCGAVPAIRPVPPSPDKPVECNNNINLIRPSQLPIYVHETSSSTIKNTTRCDDDDDDDTPRTFLEQGFGTVRKSIQGIMKEYDDVMDNISDKISTGMGHSEFMLDYLREESNLLPRVGAVAIGGLTGLIFSLRGGKFKKFIYTTAGVATVAAICYPSEAKQTLSNSKHYINIGYNFICGVKPGDENQMEIAWPVLPKLKVPSSFTEFVDLAQETGASLSATVGSLVGNKSETKSHNGNEEKPDDKSKTTSD